MTSIIGDDPWRRINDDDYNGEEGGEEDGEANDGYRELADPDTAVNDEDPFWS